MFRARFNYAHAFNLSLGSVDSDERLTTDKHQIGEEVFCRLFTVIIINNIDCVALPGIISVEHQLLTNHCLIITRGHCDIKCCSYGMLLHTQPNTNLLQTLTNY